MSNFTRKLKKDEQTIQILRRFPLTLFFPILTSLILTLAPFFLLYPLFQLGSRGVAVFCFMLALGLWLSAKTFVEWYYNVVMITDQRIIIFKQRGFFEKKFSEIDFKSVRNVSYKIKGIFSTLFNQGIIKIDLPSEGVKSNYVIILGVKSPQKIHELILHLRNEILDKQTAKELSDKLLSAEEIMENAPMKELFRVVNKIKETIGLENFKREFIGEKFEDRAEDEGGVEEKTEE